MNSQRSVSALSRHTDSQKAADDLAAQFGAVVPTAVVFFCSHGHDGAAISAALRRRYPKAEVIGCTTAGEFVERDGGVGGVSAMAMGASAVRRAHGVLCRFDHGVENGISAATGMLARSVGKDLRDVDPTRHVGILLLEGLGMKEEDANNALGVAAPQLVFVGGSAGDNLEFRETRVLHNGEAANDGAALLLLEMAVPFTIAKTCSFVPTKHRFKITRADEENRVVYELDGRPALEVYAEAVGTTPDRLDGAVFMKHPFGQMLDGEPWIRSPQQPVPDGGLKFYARILEGAEVHVMRSTDLVKETRAAMSQAAAALGGRIGGALLFNCILRRLELDAANAHQEFRGVFAGFPTTGFHTYGESYLGHVNQTCTGLVFA